VVTGGLGFIGSHLVDRLIQDAKKVTILDDLSSGQQESLRAHVSDSSLRLVRGDICETSKLDGALKGADAVVHLAAIVSVTRSIREPELVNRVNVTGTLKLLETCARNRIRRFVYASSAAVYGRNSSPPLKEDDPIRSLSAYGASKAAGEAYCQAYHETHGLETVILRLMNVYGPRANTGAYSGVMTKFAEAVMSGKPLVIYGDGEQTRDFTYISDVVNAIVLALHEEEGVDQIFNVGTGVPTTINQLARVFISISGKEGQIRHVKARRGEVRHSYADISKAKRLLGYRPRVDLQTGLSEFLRWHRETAQGLTAFSPASGR